MGMFDSYTLNKPRYTSTKTRRYVTDLTGYEIEIDLMDLSRFAEFNKNVHFLLVAIDTGSREGYVQDLQNKKSSSILVGLKKSFYILDRFRFGPKVI